MAAIGTAADQIGSTRLSLSSGRVTSESDDPPAIQTNNDQTPLGRLDAYSRSADLAAARLAAADTVLNHIIDTLTAAIVAGTTVRESRKTAAERAPAVAEVRRLCAALVDDFNASFNRGALFSGTNVTSAAYVRSAGAWTYQGNSGALQLEVDTARFVPVSFDGQAIAQGSDAVDVFTAMDALAAALETGDDSAIGAGIDALGRAFDRVSRAQGQLGAHERGVDAAAARLAALRLAAGASGSPPDDDNLAAAIARMNEADQAYRSALGDVNSAEQLSLLDYLK